MSSEYAIDIETVGLEWDGLHEEVREKLLSKARRELGENSVPSEREVYAKSRLGLSPYVARVVCIGLQNIETGDQGAFMATYDDSKSGWVTRDDGVKVFYGSEFDILTAFWAAARKWGRVVTFNGRGFDGPFLTIRSAINLVKPTVNLCGYRYALHPHCDLYDVLMFMGGYRNGSVSLDFACRSFGIESPKDSVDGASVADMWHGDQHTELLDYCLGDVRATAELYGALGPMCSMLASKGGGR